MLHAANACSAIALLGCSNSHLATRGACRVQLEAELQRALQPVARLQSLYMGVAADIANCCRSARSSSAEGSEDLDALAALVQRLDACKAKLQTLTVVKVRPSKQSSQAPRSGRQAAVHMRRTACSARRCISGFSSSALPERAPSWRTTCRERRRTC